MLRFFSAARTARPDYRKLYQEERDRQLLLTRESFAIVMVRLESGGLSFSLVGTENSENIAKSKTNAMRSNREYLQDYYYTSYDKNLIRRIENQK